MSYSAGKPFTLKIVLLGDNYVGKTSLATRFATNSFSDIPNVTIGASYWTKTVEVGADEICFQVWDTAGHEAYNRLSQMYLRGAHVAVLVYSVAEPSTFDSLQWWMETIQKEEHVPKVVIVGNKRDLKPINNDQLPLDFALKHGAQYTTVSAKTGQNIEALFNTMGIMAVRDLKKKVP